MRVILYMLVAESGYISQDCQMNQKSEGRGEEEGEEGGKGGEGMGEVVE
jgi:hypothetical protein